MAKRVKVGYIINLETRNRMKKLAKRTFRTQGKLIDWLVEKAWIEFERSNGNGTDCNDNQGETEAMEETTE